ncbi:hypothetical protein [Lignipirellula cremea]|uniref:Transmembrane protein n=1 Tax=Lignipirellula cremea TaxID=2528010 RepID=A0A518DV23_9BACT|nr:hypothetical protein [Lignipirellula cremea]QDU95679.1 hypothetical protein Pla8534_34960 [Lignipirellula cremea]
MWCRNCHQEVPGIASPEGETYICCARCFEPLTAGYQKAASRPAAPASPELPDEDYLPTAETPVMQEEEVLAEAAASLETVATPTGDDSREMNKPKEQDIAAEIGSTPDADEESELELAPDLEPVRLSTPLFADRAAPAATAIPAWEANDWEIEEELKSVDRLMRRLRRQGIAAPSPIGRHGRAAAAPCEMQHGGQNYRFDASHSPATAPPVSQPAARRTEKSPRASLLAWSVLSLSLMVFVCGAVLLGWSVVQQRGELWTVGLPLALIGQAGLVVGLVLQFEHLWQTNRQTTSTLIEIDDELENLRRTASLMGSTHSFPAQAFYAHLSDGADPQMLLADLKGQMDMLAMRLAQSRR